jgi:hypothetical protein
MAHLARDVYIRQELHFDAQLAGLAGFAASPFTLKEKAFGITTHLGVGKGGKQVADVIEHAGVGGGLERGVRRWGIGQC